MKNKKAVVWGYFTKNLGDDLMLKAFLRESRGKYRKITINSTTCFKAYYAAMGVRVVEVDSVFYRAARKLLRLLGRKAEPFFFLPDKNTDFILLGGSLYAENRDNANNLRQLTDLRQAVCRAGKAYGIGSNFGSYRSESYLKSYRELFQSCTDVCLRDRCSYELFSDLRNVRYAPDVALSGAWEDKKTQPQEPCVFLSVINLRIRPELSDKTEVYERMMAETAMLYAQKGERVVLGSFCEFEGDTEACERIRRACGNRQEIEICRYEDFRILETLVSAKKIYATRFHAVMLALYYGIAVVPLLYNEKTAHALSSYGLSAQSFDIAHMESFSPQELMNAPGYTKRISHLREQAKRQFDGICKI